MCVCVCVKERERDILFYKNKSLCVCAGTRKSMISTKFYNVPWLSSAAPMDFLQIQFWIKISLIQIWRQMILTDPEIKFCDLNAENLFII